MIRIDYVKLVAYKKETYDAIGEFQEGLASVMKNGKWGFINTKGYRVIPYIYEDVLPFSDDLAGVLKNGKWGFINKQGQEEIPCNYTDLRSFHEGLAAVKKNNRWRFINKLGKEVFVCDYLDDPANFHDGLTAITTYGLPGAKYLNKDGQIVFSTKITNLNFQEGLAIKIDNSFKAGFINQFGEEAIKCMYGKASNFSDNLACVQNNQNGKYGFINKTGEMVIPHIYNNARSFQEGLAYVRNEKNHTTGFINKLGELVIAFDSSKYYLKDFSNGLAAIEYKHKWGFINQFGKIIIPCIYDKAYDFHDGLAKVKKDNKYFFIDKTGKELELKDLNIQQDIFYLQDLKNISKEYFDFKILEYLSAFKTNLSEIVFVKENDYQTYLNSLISVYKKLQREEENAFLEDIIDKPFIKKLKDISN